MSNTLMVGTNSGFQPGMAGAGKSPSLTGAVYGGPVGANMSTLQPAASMSDIMRIQPNAPAPASGGVNTGLTVDPAAQAAAAAAAQAAAKVNALRGEITKIANSVKDIFNSRYGQVDQSAAEQTGKLNNRFATESGDITNQVGAENQKLGVAHAAGGSYDSSYRGNNVDTVTHAGEAQIRDLGTELQDNLSSVGGWAAKSKAGFDAEKAGVDNVLRHINESTDANELTSLRNQLESRITQLQANNADNNTSAQNISTLEQIAPSSARAQQLKTTLSQVVAGSAEPGQKLAIARRLVQSAQLSPQEADTLLNGVQSDIEKQTQQ